MFKSFVFTTLCACAIACASEQTFKLADGRTLQGQVEKEDDKEVVIKVQAGGIAASLRVPKSQILSTQAAPEAVADTKEPVKIAANPAKAKPANDPAFAAVRELLKDAEAESLHETNSARNLDNPIPQELDTPGYRDLYGPLSDGVYDENYRGMVYREGALPRANYLLRRFYPPQTIPANTAFFNAANPFVVVIPNASTFPFLKK